MRAGLWVLLLWAGSVHAAVNTFELKDVRFDDGGRATGFITFHDQVVEDYDVAVTGGNFAAFRYWKDTSAVAWMVEPTGEPTAYITTPSPYNWTRQLDLLLPVDAIDAKPGQGFDWITTPITAHHALSSEIDDLGHIRFVVSGQGVVAPFAAAVPEPSLWMMVLAGALLVIHRVKHWHALTAAK